MKVACIVIGSLVLLFGLSRAPHLVSLVGKEEDAKVLGRALVVGAEVVVGLGLVLYGVRANRRGG